MRIRNALTESLEHGLSVREIAAEHGLSEDRVRAHLAANEAGHMSFREWVEVRGRNNGKSQSLSNNSEVPSKVIPPFPHQNALGALSVPSVEMLDDIIDHARQGLRLCRVCGQPIHKTGKRGRPRKIHVECKSE